MGNKRKFVIHLNPVFLGEIRDRCGDVEAAVRTAIPWVIMQIAVARDPDVLRSTLDELDSDEAILRALVGCEVLGQANARPDLRQWLCDYVAERNPADGARYQLANSYSRLGAEARRSRNIPAAIHFAQKGLDTIADVPPRAVTANLYYNLGIARECSADFDQAIDAFEHAADIDDMIGRPGEVARARQRVEALRAAGFSRGSDGKDERS